MEALKLKTDTKQHNLAEELHAARELLSMFMDPESLEEGAEISIWFVPPKDDAPIEGRAAKRWAGRMLDVVSALALFSARLYNDGGRILEIELLSKPHPSVTVFRLIDGAKWEESVYGGANGREEA
jgi:hypothetical protein